MSEMIERAARALCDEHGRDPDDTAGGCHPSGQWLEEGEPWWTGYIDDLRSVLLAIREPNEVMVKAMLAEIPGKDPGLGGAIWFAMIDAALSEGS